MLNQNQNQNQASFQPSQENQSQNPYAKSQIKEQIPTNAKYSSSRPYQPPMDFRNNSNRERSRSRENSQRRQSFHEYRPGNNYIMSNRNNKPYYNRQNNDRQFESNRYKKDQFGDNYNGGYNSNFGPTKDDCLIVLPKTFFNFISKDFEKLKNDLKRELKDDIYNINYNYTIPNIQENIFRFTTNYSNNYPFKTKAIKIIADFLFDNMKKQYEKTTYLKLLFLIPDNVIGYIIGIQGKNINQIREETNAKIEVFSPSPSSKRYRKVEVAGVPQSIAEAGEKIYEITRTHFYFDEQKIINRNNRSPPRERDDRERERFSGNNNNYNDRNRRERYHQGNWNRDYENQGYNNDKDYKGMFNKDRNDYNRDMGFKNDNRNREGYRNFNGRDSNMRKNTRDYNNNYNRDNNNYRDYRDNNQRNRNNYDKGNNNRYYNDNNRRNEDDKNRENWSNQSSPRKSVSKYSNDNRSNNNNYNDGEWQEENKGDNNEHLEEQKINEENKNKENMELGEEKDNMNKNNILNEKNEKQDENLENLENKNVNEFSDKDDNLGVSNNNLNNSFNITDNERNENVLEKGEIQDLVKNLLPNNVKEKDKSCKIIVCLSSEEISLLNKNQNDNIWINLESSYKCSVSKISKTIDNQEIINLIVFNGSPKQNTLAIYQLQKLLLGIKSEQLEQNKTDN